MIDFTAIISTAFFSVALVVAIGGYTRGINLRIDALGEKIQNQKISLVKLQKDVETFSKNIS